MKTISNNIPALGKDLSAYKGSELIDKLGEDIIKDLVANILCGKNIRSLTETLTRKRLSLSNASLLITYLRSLSTIPRFNDNLFEVVGNELKKARVDRSEMSYLQWLIGLTGKSIQNVLRGSDGEFYGYLSEIEDALKESIVAAEEVFGKIEGVISYDDVDSALDWSVLTQIFMAIGAQTLAIRGSEKSMYGKLFEKLILGSLLTILGFKLVDKRSYNGSLNKIFWLSERGDKRESDATIIFKPGVGVRFDLGFIGPGNTEISLDKVSRFERNVELGNHNYYMKTIVIVDRIGDRSRITDMAKEINGSIVQMSMSYWVKEVAKILSDSLGYNHAIVGMNNEQSTSYIKDEMLGIDLRKFLSKDDVDGSDID